MKNANKVREAIQSKARRIISGNVEKLKDLRKQVNFNKSTEARLMREITAASEVLNPRKINPRKSGGKRLAALKTLNLA